MAMRPRCRIRERRLLAITAALAVLDSCSTSATVSATPAIAFSLADASEDAAWIGSDLSVAAVISSESSSNEALPTPAATSEDASVHTISVSDLLSDFLPPPRKTKAASRTPPPGINSWLAWMPAAPKSKSPAAAALDELIHYGESASQSNDDAGGSAASSSDNGDADVGDGSEGENAAPEDAVSTPSPNGFIDDSKIQQTPTPTAGNTPSHTPHKKVVVTPMPIPTSPSPVSIFRPQDAAETPPPPPTEQATESPPPPKSVLILPASRTTKQPTAPPSKPPSPSASTTKPSSTTGTGTNKSSPPTGTTKPSSSSATQSPQAKGADSGSRSGSDAADGTRSLTDAPSAARVASASSSSSSSSSTPAQPTQEDGTMISGQTPSILAPSSPSDPVASTDTATPTPLTPEPSRRFHRGDNVVVLVQDSSASGAPVSKSVVVTPSQSPALVIGGDHAASSTTTSTSTSDWSSSSMFTFLQYLTSVVALLSLLWLASCSMLVAGSSTLTLSWPVGDPNQWEFRVFVAHIQGLASFSHVITTSKMPAFFVRFLDVFSWTVNLPFHGSTPGIGPSRRLDAVVLDGIVAFADRIGVNEGNLLTRSVAAFVAVLGVVGIIIGVASCFVLRGRDLKTQGENSGDHANGGTNRTATPAPVETTSQRPSRKSLWVSVGLLVLVWQFSLYPLAMFASYEISMELQPSGPVRGGPFSLAVLVLAFLCVGVLVGCAVSVWRLNSRQKMAAHRNLAVWGSLFDGLRVQHRLFFIVFAVVQVMRGVIIGCVVDGTIQLAVLLAIDAVVLGAVFLLRPFQPTTLLFTIAMLGLRILTTALAFAFARSSSSSVHRSIAISLIALHTSVILLWIARNLNMARRVVQLRRQHEPHVDMKTPAPVENQEQTPHGAAYTSFHPEIHSNERRGPGAPYSSAWDDSI